MCGLSKKTNHEIVNSFGVKSYANLLIELSNVETVEKALENIDLTDKKIIGRCFNTVPKSKEIAVIKVTDDRIKIVSQTDIAVELEVMAGADWDELVHWSISFGLVGLENMSAIPSSVGASPIHNIGAYGVEISPFISSVKVFDFMDRKVKHLSNSECDFEYRTSVFKKNTNLLILSVSFNIPRVKTLGGLLKEAGFLKSLKLVLNLAYLILSSVEFKGKKKFLLGFGFDKVRDFLLSPLISPRTKRRLVIFIRKRLLLDPKKKGNSGCFFKCPIITHERFSELKLIFPDIESFPHSDNKIKVSACWLIRKAGWAGRINGDVEVPYDKPVVLCNHGSATYESVSDVTLKIRKDINIMFDIDLEPEVII